MKKINKLNASLHRFRIHWMWSRACVRLVVCMMLCHLKVVAMHIDSQMISANCWHNKYTVQCIRQQWTPNTKQWLASEEENGMAQAVGQKSRNRSRVLVALMRKNHHKTTITNIKQRNQIKLSAHTHTNTTDDATCFYCIKFSHNGFRQFHIHFLCSLLPRKSWDGKKARQRHDYVLRNLWLLSLSFFCLVMWIG